MRARKAFTLIELLVVVGIIVILVSLLFPVLRRVHEHANQVKCQSNERTIWQACLAFAADHDNCLPGNCFDGAQTDLGKQDWLMGTADYGGTGDDYTQAPQKGTLFPYVGGALGQHLTSNTTQQDPTVGSAYAIYRCPSRINVMPNKGQTIVTDASTNGRFDYAMFLSFAGCPLAQLPQNATVDLPGAPGTVVPCPIVCEESPGWLNNGANDEGGHGNFDQLAHEHSGGSFYISPDGAANFFIEPLAINANYWFAIAPSGKRSPIGVSKAYFGYWTHQ